MIVETTREDYASLLSGRGPRSFTLADTPIAPLDTLQMLAGLDARVAKTFTPASWLIVEENEVVGLCSIIRPPKGDEIAIGYGIAPSRQGRGVASRAVGEVIAWAGANALIRAVTAETTVTNIASQRVLIRNGFVQIGERLDGEDGPLLCWRLATD
jgi:RimJ/RimL family protein N-acetyltransferase